MKRSHWPWIIVAICILAVLVLAVMSFFFDKDVPGPVWAIFSSVATGIIGLEYRRPEGEDK